MIFFVIAALLVVLDQATKFYIRATMAVGATKVLIPNWLGLNYVQNTGAAFSSFDQYTMILAIVSLVVSILLILAIAFKWVRHPFGRFTLMLILAGAVGNLIDRALLGYVTDMFETLFMRFAVFNVADICVVCGAVLAVIYYLWFYEKYDKRGKAHGDADAPSES